MYIRVTFPHNGPDGSSRQVGQVLSVDDVEGQQAVRDGHAKETNASARSRPPETEPSRRRTRPAKAVAETEIAGVPDPEAQ